MRRKEMKTKTSRVACDDDDAACPFFPTCTSCEWLPTPPLFCLCFDPGDRADGRSDAEEQKLIIVHRSLCI